MDYWLSNVRSVIDKEQNYRLGMETEKAKNEMRQPGLTSREMQRIQDRVQEDIKPFVGEMVRLRSTAVPVVEMRTGG